jgi:hypothetical protein
MDAGQFQPLILSAPRPKLFGLLINNPELKELILQGKTPAQLALDDSAKCLWTHSWGPKKLLYLNDQRLRRDYLKERAQRKKELIIVGLDPQIQYEQELELATSGTGKARPEFTQAAAQPEQVQPQPQVEINTAPPKRSLRRISVRLPTRAAEQLRTTSTCSLLDNCDCTDLDLDLEAALELAFAAHCLRFYHAFAYDREDCYKNHDPQCPQPTQSAMGEMPKARSKAWQILNYDDFKNSIPASKRTWNDPVSRSPKRR